jgi:hypothetical protein
MKETELAWLAGIMEGEGTFAIYHQKTGDGPKGQLRGSISLTNTDPFLINKCFDLFKDMGIELYMHSYDNKKGSTRTVYDLQTSKHTYVKIVCETLLPYLIGEKNAKAKMLLRFVNGRITKGKGPYDEDDWKQFKAFRSPETTRETLTSEDIVQL